MIDVTEASTSLIDDHRVVPEPERVTILGATGSIGDSTLDVVARHPERFRVFALTANSRIGKLFEQCVRFHPEFAVVADEAAASELSGRCRVARLTTRVLHGQEGLELVAAHRSVDIVVTGIVGAAGLVPTIAAVGSRRRVLVANKEPLVMMGRAILATAQRHGATIIPLDSEHNAIFQCLPRGFTDGGCQGRPKGVRSIVLTASGGPFRTLSLDQLLDVTPKQAIAHPNWSMGRKISVDSATLMNKGLELIEACALFAVDPADVRVVIHPQSTIHSMVEYIDGSVIAQMGAADMRIPIAHGLGWPERIESGAPSLDFRAVNQLDFEEPDEVRFPCLRLAREAARAGGASPIVLNAANEVAVEAFLADRLSFPGIAAIIEETLARFDGPFDESLAGVMKIDGEARRIAHLCLADRPLVFRPEDA